MTHADHTDRPLEHFAQKACEDDASGAAYQTAKCALFGDIQHRITRDAHNIYACHTEDASSEEISRSLDDALRLLDGII